MARARAWVPRAPPRPPAAQDSATHPNLAPALFTPSALCPPLLALAAIYVLLYSVHYFFAKTKMTGFFQTAFYFGYTLMFCCGLAGERRAREGKGGAPFTLATRSCSAAGWRVSLQGGGGCRPGRCASALGGPGVPRATRAQCSACLSSRSLPCPLALCHAHSPTLCLAPHLCCVPPSAMCGAMGYLGASAFVRRIYRNIKCD